MNAIPTCLSVEKRVSLTGSVLVSPSQGSSLPTQLISVDKLEQSGESGVSTSFALPPSWRTLSVFIPAHVLRPSSALALVGPIVIQEEGMLSTVDGEGNAEDSDGQADELGIHRVALQALEEMRSDGAPTEYTAHVTTHHD